MEGPSVRKIRTICVFCGSTMGKEKEFATTAINLGQSLAVRGIDLVYGGGCLGLMGCVAASAAIRGCKVKGIIPKVVADKRIAGATIGEEIQVMTIPEGMATMLCYADAFIALPGGLGTLDELFSVVSWAQLNIHRKPIGLLNVNGFYDGLLTFLDQAVEHNFISQADRKIIVSAPTADQLIDQLQVYKYEPHPALLNIDWSTPPTGSKKEELDLTLRL